MQSLLVAVEFMVKDLALAFSFGDCISKELGFGGCESDRSRQLLEGI
jgi:hypothetical protein